MSFDELIPKSASVDNATPAVQVWAGKIAENAESADDRIYVIIPGADGSQHRHGPCGFDPRGVQLPEKGDDCLIVFDEDGDPWIVSWTPADGTDPPGPGGGPAELPTAEIFDYFPDAALGSLTDADSEQTYHSTATSAPFELTVQSSGGKKVLTHSAVSGAGAGYAELPLDGDARWAFARVRFQPGSTPGSAIAIAFPEQSIALGGLPQIAPHTAFNPVGSWGAGVWEGTPSASYDTTGDSGALSGASTLGFAPYDGVTECLLGFTVDDHGILRMLLPNGDVVTTQDARYKTLCGPYAFIEIFVTDAATDAKPEIIEWQAGTTESEAAQWLMDRGQTAELVKKMLERYPSTALVAASLATKLESSVLDTDGTLAANSDAKVATQKATKTYADLMVPKAGGTMTGTLVGKNGTVTDTAMGPRSNQFGLYSTSVALIALARAGVPVFEASPVSVKFANQFIQADKGLKSTYYTADDAYRIYTPNAAADGTATLAANYTPGDGIMYFDDVSLIVSSGLALKTGFAFTLDGTNWYVGTSVNSGTNSIACQLLTGTDTAYAAGVDYFQTPSSYGDNNCVMPTYGAPYMTVSVAATNDRNVWLPPRVSVGAWTKPAVACEYGILVDNVTAGKIITVRDGYDGRIISQVTGGASSYGVGLRIKYDGYTGYFPIGKDAAP